MFEDEEEIIKLLDVNDSFIGEMSISKAKTIAEGQGYDITCISESLIPPLYKVVNLDKYRYEQQKKSKIKKPKTKEIKFKPNITDHDYNVKLSHIKKFLSKGLMVKITLVFKGREIQHKSVGEQILQNLIEDLENLVQPIGNSKSQGNNVTIILSPIKQVDAG